MGCSVTSLCFPCGRNHRPKSLSWHLAVLPWVTSDTRPNLYFFSAMVCWNLSADSRLPQRLSLIKGLPYCSREAGAGSPATARFTAGTQVCMPTGWARLLPILFAYSIGSHSSHEETLFMDGCQIVEWGGDKWGTSYLAILLTSLLSCFLKQPVTLLGFLVIGWYLFQFSWPQISMLFVFMLLLITLLLWNNFRFPVKLQR